MASISEKMVEALNEQINAEIYSAYLYLSMAAYFDSIGLKGFANWMRVQWQEELTHAMRLYDYVVERGGRVKLYAIEEPPSEWESPLTAFEHTYEHEVNVTKRIHELVELAMSEKDYATYNMLQWFVAEQVEEEANASEIVDKLRLIGDDGRGLLMLDTELGARRFVPEQEDQTQ
ncbi:MULTISPECIES: ferritin [unclassified Archaeoglobus]|jgi:ferritin|uniref:ferritin n=1 Tax=unclassified Archaeoglobus TaxID=2643606 RepID=UPI0025C24E6D|nr:MULTISPECIES: ferritin [unclassified Archaeoglobus]